MRGHTEVQRSRISIHWLPRIEATLDIEGVPQFAVVSYADFIRVSAAATAGDVPDLSAVLDVAGEHVLVVLQWGAYRTFLSQFEVTGRVDERDYLQRHEDVRSAVERGDVVSATEHYVVQGYFEQRPVRLA